jgi:hypothetical protein
MSPIPLGIFAASGFGVVSAFDLLATTSLTSSASSVTFSGLGAYSDYKHLQLRMVVRSASTQTGGTADCLLTINGASSGYALHYLRGDGSSVISNASPDRSNIEINNFAVNGGGNTNVYSPAVMDFLDFSSSNKNTNLRTFFGSNVQNATYVQFVSGLLTSTAPMTSFNFSVNGNNLAAGSRFSIYGIKG